MTTICFRTVRLRRVLLWTLSIATATAPSVSALAQTNAAAMSVRQRVEGTSPEGPESSPPGAPGPAPGQPAAAAAPSAGKLDVRYVSSTATIVVVVRPAQIL